MAQCGRTGRLFTTCVYHVLIITPDRANVATFKAAVKHFRLSTEKRQRSLHAGLHQDVKTYTGHRDEANARNRDL